MSYGPSDYQAEINDLNPTAKQRAYYTLGFEYTFEYTGDEVYVAYTVPYTYSQTLTHIEFLKSLDDENYYNFLRFESAGRSRAGVDVPIVKLTSVEKGKKEKPVVVVISRQHSGETHSSFVVHGLMNFLLSKDFTANKLRKEFEWWFLPCVNPDGVIVGNYRANTQGKDMNRNFFAPDDASVKPEDRCPEVELLTKYLRENLPKDPLKFKMFLDMHGHSSRRSIFAFCPLDPDEKIAAYIQEFPEILDDGSAFFQFDNCKFSNEKYKRNCARLGVYRDFGQLNSFTIESSCHGWEVKGGAHGETKQFKEFHLLMFGKELAHGISKHLEAEPTEKDLSAMTYGYNIDLDFGLYTRKTREMRRRDRKREKEREKEREAALARSRSQAASGLDGSAGLDGASCGIRISVDSSLANTSNGTFNDPLTERKHRVSSKQSSRSTRHHLGANLGGAGGKQGSTGLNFNAEGSLPADKLILNQSQRDYFKKRKEQPPGSRRDGFRGTGQYLLLEARDEEKAEELDRLEARSVGR